MKNFLIFEFILLAVVIVSALSGIISFERAGQVFLAMGIIDIILSMAAWRGWSILRGNISNDEPLSKRDLGEVAYAEYALDHEQPSTRYIVRIAGIGVVALGVGIILMWLYS